MAEVNVAQLIERKLQEKTAKLISFAGSTLLMDAAAAIYVPVEQCLIVSDLHLEKGSYLRHQHHPIPGYDSADTLKRLSNLIDAYQPQRLVSLGDSFHDLNALVRMQTTDWQALLALIARVPQWQWILGNHDPALPPELPGQQCVSAELGEIELCHEPSEYESATKPEIIGHFHPKKSVSLGRRKVTGKCFMFSQNRLIMPSFGSYTGGLDSEDQAFSSLFSHQERRYVLLHAQKVWSVA